MAYTKDTKTITIHLTTAEYDALKGESESTRVTMTAIIREALAIRAKGAKK